MDNCQITGNNAFFGAGVYDKGTATVTNCTISGNTGARGTGVFEKGTGTVSDSVISNNSAIGGGGGFYNDNQLTVNNCTISGDSAGNGGGVYDKTGTASLVDCTISGSSGLIDGGNLENLSGATLKLSYCQVLGGAAVFGAGLYNNGMATVTDCTISDNVAAAGGQGGGIANGANPQAAAGVLTVTDSTIMGNTAPFGGGGLFNAGTATLTDSTIAANSGNGGAGTGNGGGVANEGAVTLVACTVSGNQTTNNGGGLYNGPLGTDEVALDDTIVAGNTTASGGVPNDIGVSSGLSVSGSYNLIGPGGSGGITGTTNIILTSLAGLDLAPLGDYGGPTQTMALETGSMAIGNGSSTISGVTIPSTDQSGFPLDRPPDIGAYQTINGPLVVDVTTDNAGEPLPANWTCAGGQPRQPPIRVHDHRVQPDHVRDGANDHSDRGPARAERHRRDADDHRTGRRRDLERQ